MPDKGGAGGWRKKIRPKELRVTTGESIVFDESNERPRRHSDKVGWRKTIHGGSSRPGTPASAATPTLQVDVDDTRSEGVSEASTPRRATKPKLSRLMSSYRNLKETPKEPEFGTPWSEDAPPPYTSPVDPLMSLQSTYSHMIALPTQPIPVDYNNGLFRVFEDYRKVRQEREHLDSLLQEALEDYKNADTCWAETESRYQAEIRRLELLIARGTSGMTGLVRARQDSVVNRRPLHRKTISVDRPAGTLEDLSSGQLNKQIGSRSQKALLHRPSSPSGKMAALSRQLSSTGSEVDLPVGTPPSEDTKMTLSRKVQSDLDLTKLSAAATTGSIPRSVGSEFSWTGDPLPDEIEPMPVSTSLAIDCDIYAAIQDLGSLVAQKKGIDAARFLNEFMKLFSTEDRGVREIFGKEMQVGRGSNVTLEPSRVNINEVSTLTPDRELRHFRSQPQLGSERRQRRHFSFEPGDDQVAALEQQVNVFELSRPALMTNWTESNFESLGNPIPTARMRSTSRQSQMLNAETQKPSKIPSPVQRPGLGTVRRESSTSSLQTLVGRSYAGGRRSSNTSVLTALHKNSSGTLRSVSRSRSRSTTTSRKVEGQYPDPAGSLNIGDGVAATAGVEATDHMDDTSVSRSRTLQPIEISSTGSTIKASRPPREPSPENNSPHERSRGLLPNKGTL